MYLRTINSIKNQYRRHLGLGVFIDIWSMGERYLGLDEVPGCGHLLHGDDAGVGLQLTRGAHLRYLNITQNVVFQP